MSFLCLTLAIRLLLCECLQPFEACIDCCLNYVDVVREYTIERKTAASLWEQVLTYWCQEVGWSSPSIQPTFYRPELIAGLAFTLRSKDRATTRTRHILLNKICYHWHSTRYHLLFLFRLLHRPQGARSVAQLRSLERLSMFPSVLTFLMLFQFQSLSYFARLRDAISHVPEACKECTCLLFLGKISSPSFWKQVIFLSILSLRSPCVGDRVDFVCRIKPHQL